MKHDEAENILFIALQSACENDYASDPDTRDKINEAWHTVQKSFTYDFETEPHVCKNCGGDNWHYNTFFHNKTKKWLASGQYDFWCEDCYNSTSIIHKEDFKDEWFEEVTA